MNTKYDLRLRLTFEGDTEYFHPVLGVVYLTEKGEVRNPITREFDSPLKGLCGLQFSAQANQGQTTVHQMYARGWRYRNMFSLDSRELHDMLGRIKLIERRSEKLLATMADDEREMWASSLDVAVSSLGCTSEWPIGIYTGNAWSWHTTAQAELICQQAMDFWNRRGYVPTISPPGPVGDGDVGLDQGRYVP